VRSKEDGHSTCCGPVTTRATSRTSLVRVPTTTDLQDVEEAEWLVLAAPPLRAAVLDKGWTVTC
jgi:hypothetical protein